MKDNLAKFFKMFVWVNLHGGRAYYVWVIALLTVFLVGVGAYIHQLDRGLIVTGMNDHVSWGLYISNFTFLVGLAAAAVMLVLPAYVFGDIDFKKAVLMGEGVAVAALVMCLAFVVADMGGPTRLWHMIPVIGHMNWPDSMLTWDVIVLNGYLALNLLVPFYILYSHFCQGHPDPKKYLPFVFLSIFWAFAIHLVTAFLYAGLPARPFWNSSLMGPRFLASAFAAGPAFIIVLLTFIKKHYQYDVPESVFKKLALICTVAAQINLVMLVSEVFKEFYHPTEHSLSAIYLFKGIGEFNRLSPWIQFAIGINATCTAILSVHRWRGRNQVLLPTLVCLFVAIWLEKGLGLIVPGFIPSPLGEIVEYSPTLIEWLVTFGIWALGLLTLTFLVRFAVPVESGRLNRSASPSILSRQSTTNGNKSNEA